MTKASLKTARLRARIGRSRCGNYARPAECVMNARAAMMNGAVG
jgi:hypothetical protein